MAKVFIEETTLTAIGDAIRGKTGKTELIDPANMHSEIASIEAGGGGGAEVPDVVITGSASYACSGAVAGAFISSFPNKVTTKNITNGANMFYMSTIERVPFDINISKESDMNNFFHTCSNLVESPPIDCKHTTYHNVEYFFYNCSKLESIAPVLNAYPTSITNMFGGCSRLRTLPDDFFSSWNFSRLLTYNYANLASIFYSCYSLRRIPSSLFEKLKPGVLLNSYYNQLYYNMCCNCHVLDEVTNVPLPDASVALTSAAFYNTTQYAGRLKRFTFATNDDGTPKVAKMKAQILDMTQSVGYNLNTTQVTKYNSGLTTATQVTDDTSYQALKNDPDYWTTTASYSRYNHDSAVETINSLPDTSAYLASAGGTNTIKFVGAAGSKTDGGAINTLTEEEIAVAAAKGWTVTLV